MSSVRWAYVRGFVRGRLWLYGEYCLYAVYFVRGVWNADPIILFDGWQRLRRSGIDPETGQRR